jgi:hypothetical protein
MGAVMSGDAAQVAGRRAAWVYSTQFMLPELVGELEPNLDRIDPELFSNFFTYRGPEASPPSRVGYYISALVAQRVAKRHSLVGLAHMSANRVRKELGAQLAAFR